MKFIWIAFVFCAMKNVVTASYSRESKLFTEAMSRWDSTHGYLEVRPGAHLFYWLFYANGTKAQATEKPLVIWIQGGPGFAASGIGNFAELGPVDMDMNPRNHTWVKERNVLFIDHPVDTGFSYVSNSSNDSIYVHSDRELATDLAKAIKLFYRKHKEFRTTPSYLIGQSYGGKICPRLAYYLVTAIERRSLKMNFKGIGIGGGFVYPRESCILQPRFLYYSGAIDRHLYVKAKKISSRLVGNVDKKNYSAAGELDNVLFETLNEENELNFNNLQKPNPYPALNELINKVNAFVKPKLINANQSIDWSYLSSKGYYYLQNDFFMPTTSFLESLLNNTKLKIAIYNGNLDAVTPLPGAANWVHKLKWHGAVDFRKAKRKLIQGDNNGYYKTLGHLSFWSVFGAGHWVPEDNPVAMEQILKYLMADGSHNNTLA